MPKRPDDDLNPRPIGHRLRLTRNALRMTQAQFSAAAGIAKNTYGQYEQGTRLIPPGNAVALCHAHTLTLDWIYLGEPDSLPYKLGAAIKAMSSLGEVEGAGSGGNNARVDKDSLPKKKIGRRVVRPVG